MEFKFDFIKDARYTKMSDSFAYYIFGYACR